MFFIVTDGQVNNIFSFLCFMISIITYGSNEDTDSGVSDTDLEWQDIKL
jgi:hypothetical protein